MRLTRDNFPDLERKLRTVSSVFVTCGSLTLALAGCSSDTGSSYSPFTGPSDVSSTLTFDDLGANSSIVQVYPGVSDSDADKKANGTYNDGDTVNAECKTSGRRVDSVPPETPRSSDQWIRIQSGNGTQFTTAVYAENPDALLAQLSKC